VYYDSPDVSALFSAIHFARIHLAALMMVSGSTHSRVVMAIWLSSIAVWCNLVHGAALCPCAFFSGMLRSCVCHCYALYASLSLSVHRYATARAN
jgi:hypothetical protein